MLDPVTGLAGAALFEHHVARAIVRTERGGTVAVIVCDLDGFTVVNELLGRAAGDVVLKEAGRRLERACRRGDVVARVGGNAFALLLADLPSDPDLAGDVVHDRGDVLREALGVPYLGAEAVPVSASVGTALTPDGDTTARGLLEAARTTMHAAKQLRRARLV